MIHAKQALLRDGWANDVRIRVAGGRITGIETATAALEGDHRVDTLLPGMGNLHSHAFQRAMAGMTERRAAGRDSFWSWRDLMYRFMERLTPDQIEAIAALVYMEMLEAGYTAVGEFHYVHHQRGGLPYDDPAELTARIYAAAHHSGIGLTHLPVLYTYGGAGKQALSEGQRRFGNDVDGFATLVSAARRGMTPMPDDWTLGIAPHSLRATSPEDLHRVLEGHAGGPVHIHIAEQPKEVADISDWLGARPVEWLLDNAPVNSNWCLIHATHMTDAETQALAKSGAVAGLCPITEANLGDGPFNAPGFLDAGGAFGIGSDSNVNISLTEELRTLEYSQRLRDLARNVMVKNSGSVGDTLYVGAARGGALALGRASGDIATGLLADLVAIDSTETALCALRQDQLLDGLVFAAKDHVVTDVWAAGRHMVCGGRHNARDAIAAGYRTAMDSLISSL